MIILPRYRFCSIQRFKPIHILFEAQDWREPSNVDGILKEISLIWAVDLFKRVIWGDPQNAITANKMPDNKITANKNPNLEITANKGSKYRDSHGISICWPIKFFPMTRIYKIFPWLFSVLTCTGKNHRKFSRKNLYKPKKFKKMWYFWSEYIGKMW